MHLLETLFALQFAVAETMPSLNLWGLLRQGGWAMYPLGACCLLFFFLLFYSLRETGLKHFINPALSGETRAAMEKRDTVAVTRILTPDPAALSRITLLALSKARPNDPDGGREEMEAVLAEALELEENNVGQWVNYLNVVASVSPMIGLLGTVSGMISAFQTISAGGMGRPELLAGDIGEALVTTATGLVIGIPAMIAYFVLRNRLNNALLATAREASEIVDVFSKSQPRPKRRPRKALPSGTA